MTLIRANMGAPVTTSPVDKWVGARKMQGEMPVDSCLKPKHRGFEAIPSDRARIFSGVLASNESRKRLIQMKLKQAASIDKADNDLLQIPLRMLPSDLSGTPIALIESARRRNCLEVRDEVEDHEILIEFPFGSVPREQTGCSRFIRFRSGGYALIR